MPAHNTAPATPTTPATPRAKKNFNAVSIIIFLVATLGVISLINGFALPRMSFRSAMDRNDDVGTGNKAADEAVGRQHLRKVDQIVKAIDADRITDPETLKKELDPARDNTEKMRAVARGEKTPSGTTGAAIPQPTCKGTEVLEGGVLRLQVLPSCKSEFEIALVNTRMQKTYKVQFTSEDLEDPPFTTSRGTANFNYDAATKTVTIDGDLYYKQTAEHVGKQATIILKPIS